MSCLVRLPRTPSARIVTFAWISTPGSNVARVLPMAADAAIARSHSDHTLAVHQQLGRGKSRKHVDAFSFDQPDEPLPELLKRDDVVAVIAQAEAG